MASTATFLPLSKSKRSILRRFELLRAENDALRLENHHLQERIANMRRMYRRFYIAAERAIALSKVERP
jgi:regulator of replication initiation timing